jgi:protoheme ferro-lyase
MLSEPSKPSCLITNTHIDLLQHLYTLRTMMWLQLPLLIVIQKKLNLLHQFLNDIRFKPIKHNFAYLTPSTEKRTKDATERFSSFFMSSSTSSSYITCSTTKFTFVSSVLRLLICLRLTKSFTSEENFLFQQQITAITLRIEDSSSLKIIAYFSYISSTVAVRYVGNFFFLF